MISRDDLHPAQPREYPSFGVSSTTGDSRSAEGSSRLAVLLAPITSLVAGAFLIVAGYKEWAAPNEELLERVAVGAAMFFFTLRLIVGHFDWPKRRSHFTATVAALFAIAYPLVTLWATRDAWATNYIALTLVLIGFLYTSRVWFWMSAILIAGAWTGVALPLLTGEQAVDIATVVVVAIMASLTILELRLRKLTRFERSLASQSKSAAKDKFPASIATLSSSLDAKAQGWCPVCKAAQDAIVRYNGDTVVDANPAATKLLGMSVSELVTLPVLNLFAEEKRDAIAPVLRLGNFQPFETIAAGFKDECIPVEVLNGGLTLEADGFRALVLRDLREQEKVRLTAAAANRKAQQSALRIRELSLLASRGAQDDLDGYLLAVVKSLHRWLPCSIGCFVVMWDNQAEAFSCMASSAPLPLQSAEISLDAENQTILGWLTENLEPLVIPNVRADHDRFSVRKLYPNEPVNAFCALPLTNSAGLMGFMLALERSNREFAAEDIDYLTLAAHCVASACSEAMMLAQLEQQ